LKVALIVLTMTFAGGKGERIYPLTRDRAKGIESSFLSREGRRKGKRNRGLHHHGRCAGRKELKDEEVIMTKGRRE